MLMMITMMVITTINSTKVKPRTPLRARATGVGLANSDGCRDCRLPLGIRCSIGCLLLRLAVHGEDVLAAPTGRCRVVLIAAQAPFPFAGEGIGRDAAEEADFLAVGVVGQFYAFHQLFERLGVAIGSDLHGAEVAGVAEVLIFVDRGMDGAEVVTQLPLALHAN